MPTAWEISRNDEKILGNEHVIRISRGMSTFLSVFGKRIELVMCVASEISPTPPLPRCGSFCNRRLKYHLFGVCWPMKRPETTISVWQIKHSRRISGTWYALVLCHRPAELASTLMSLARSKDADLLQAFEGCYEGDVYLGEIDDELFLLQVWSSYIYLLAFPLAKHAARVHPLYLRHALVHSVHCLILPCWV